MGTVPFRPNISTLATQEWGSYTWGSARDFFLPSLSFNHRSDSSVQSFTCVQFFETPWTTAHQSSLSITNSWSLLKLMSIKSVMPSNHLIPCHPLLLLPSIFPRIRVFSSESVLLIKWSPFLLRGWQLTIKIAEQWRIDAFLLWCWRRVLSCQLGQQGDLTGPSWRKSVLNIHWKDWC